MSQKTKQLEIPKNLIGRNIVYEILRKPFKKLDKIYPSGAQVKYSDDYLNRLNELYNLGDVLGEKTGIIAKGNFSGSLLYKKNIQGAEALWHILMRSIQSGGWQPSIIDFNFYHSKVGRTARVELERIKKDVLDHHTIGVYNYRLFGLEKVRREGLVAHIEYDNKVISVPTQSFIEKIAREKEHFHEGQFYPLM